MELGLIAFAPESPSSRFYCCFGHSLILISGLRVQPSLDGPHPIKCTGAPGRREGRESPVFLALSVEQKPAHLLNKSTPGKISPRSQQRARREARHSLSAVSA